MNRQNEIYSLNKRDRNHRFSTYNLIIFVFEATGMIPLLPSLLTASKFFVTIFHPFLEKISIRGSR